MDQIYIVPTPGLVFGTTLAGGPAAALASELTPQCTADAAEVPRASDGGESSSPRELRLGLAGDSDFKIISKCFRLLTIIRGCKAPNVGSSSIGRQLSTDPKIAGARLFIGKINTGFNGEPINSAIRTKGRPTRRS